MNSFFVIKVKFLASVILDEWVCYRDFVSFPENKEKLGRILGTCKNEGNEISQSIVTSRVHAITRRTI